MASLIRGPASHTSSFCAHLSSYAQASSPSLSFLHLQPSSLSSSSCSSVWHGPCVATATASTSIQDLLLSSRADSPSDDTFGSSLFGSLSEVVSPPEPKPAVECPPGLCRYETMAVLRPDITEEQRLDLTQRYEEVALRRIIFNKTVDAVWGIYGQSTTEQPRSHASIVASLDSDAGKADGARKALEQAFQGKNTLAKKWEEEIRKRELSGGDGISGGGSRGGSGGGGWGGVGGGGDEEMGEGSFQDEPWDWEEIGQTSMATFALLMLYLSITHGPRQILKKFKLLFRYIRQGFKLRKIPDEYLTAEGSGIPSDDEELDEEVEDDYADSGKATAEVIRQRGADGQEAVLQKDDASDDETEDDKEDVDNGIPTLPTKQLRTEDLLRKRQAENKEKVRQLLTPKELRQQQEETK